MKKRLFSVLKYCTAATLVVALVTGLTQTGFSPGKEAKAAENDIVVGNTYRFGGYYWIAAEDKGDWVVLQSKGVTSGDWPGYKMEKWGNYGTYESSIDDRDISSYDEKTQKLYNAIKYAEYGSSGLYLISNSKAGTRFSSSYGSGYYCQALKEAAANYSFFGADYSHAWLGTYGGGPYAWYVDSVGVVYDNEYQNLSRVVAPAFNLDKSKVIVSGNDIKYSHSLSYDVATNGGTSSKPHSIEVDPDTVLSSSSTALSKTASKPGWTFVGWNTDPNAHEPLTSLKMSSDKTLYAIFRKDLTVTFIDAGS